MAALHVHQLYDDRDKASRPSRLTWDDAGVPAQRSRKVVSGRSGGRSSRSSVGAGQEPIMSSGSNRSDARLQPLNTCLCIAFVVPRYGEALLGSTRRHAERIAPGVPALLAFSTSSNAARPSHQANGGLVALFGVSQYLGHQLAKDIGGVLVAHRHCSNPNLARAAWLAEFPDKEPTMSAQRVLDRVLPIRAATSGQSQTETSS